MCSKFNNISSQHTIVELNMLVSHSILPQDFSQGTKDWQTGEEGEMFYLSRTLQVLAWHRQGGHKHCYATQQEHSTHQTT